MSDPSSGVAHPVFFPAGRLDPVVTLTRDIAMYLIGPFLRPQFFRGPRPQFWPFRGPSSRVRGAISPRTGPRTPAEHRAEPTRRAARHDSRQSIGTTRARPSTPGSARRRAARHREAEHANRRPAAHRRNPAQRPHRFRTRDDEPPRRPRRARADASRSDYTRSGGTIKAPAKGSASVTHPEQ